MLNASPIKEAFANTRKRLYKVIFNKNEPPTCINRLIIQKAKRVLWEAATITKDIFF